MTCVSPLLCLTSLHLYAISKPTNNDVTLSYTYIHLLNTHHKHTQKKCIKLSLPLPSHYGPLPPLLRSYAFACLNKPHDALLALKSALSFPVQSCLSDPSVLQTAVHTLNLLPIHTLPVEDRVQMLTEPFLKAHDPAPTERYYETILHYYLSLIARGHLPYSSLLSAQPLCNKLYANTKSQAWLKACSFLLTVTCEVMPDSDGRMAGLMGGKVEGSSFQDDMLRLSAARLSGPAAIVKASAGREHRDIVRLRCEAAAEVGEGLRECLDAIRGGYTGWDLHALALGCVLEGEGGGEDLVEACWPESREQDLVMLRLGLRTGAQHFEKHGERWECAGEIFEVERGENEAGRGGGGKGENGRRGGCYER